MNFSFYQKYTVLKQLMVFLLVGFLFFHVRTITAQQTPCTELILTPSSGEATATFLLKGVGCKVYSDYRIIISSDLDDPLGEGQISSQIYPINAEQFTYTIPYFLPADTSGITFPKSYAIFLIRADLTEYMSRTLTITGITTPPTCGSTITQNQVSQCPSECPGTQVSLGTWMCTVPPTIPTPSAPTRSTEWCTLTTPVVTKCNQNGKDEFNVGFTINDEGLVPGIRYELVENALNPHIISFTAPTNGYAFGIDNFEKAKYDGKIVEFYVRRSGIQDDPGKTLAEGCLEIIPKACMVPSCSVSVSSFNWNTVGPDPTKQFCYNDPNPTTNPFPETTAPPPVTLTTTPGSNTGSGGTYQYKLNDCNSGKGMMTAVGCVEPTPAGIVKKVFELALGVGGGIALLLIIYGGFRILISAGNPEALNEGKEIVISAIVGLLLIIFSVVILKIIGVDILCLPGLCTA